jgi:hypothetical protein
VSKSLASISALAFVAIASVACGRTGLDARLGSAGAAGAGAAAGASGTTTGSAGTGNIAGAGGGSTAGAGGHVPPCVDGMHSCADAQTAQDCIEGVLLPRSCPSGCFGPGVCAECVPGTWTCLPNNQTQLCDANGVLQAPITCPNECVNGDCVTCAEGETRCTSVQAQQRCKGGQWLPAEVCDFACADVACVVSPQTVFVTSQAFVGGSLGGLTGADRICQKLASAAGIAGNFAAWLSDSTGSPADRFIKDVGPYRLLDGTLIANNWTELTSGTLRHPIDLTEMGTMPAFANTTPCSGFPVWSNTSPDGSELEQGSDCGDWSDPTASNAEWGDSQDTTLAWTRSCGLLRPGSQACSDTAGLYCFGQ